MKFRYEPLYQKFNNLKSKPNVGMVWRCSDCENVFSCGDKGVFCSKCGSNHVKEYDYLR